MSKKLAFPKYLNRPRIWLYWEQDEIKFAFQVSIVVVGVMFALTLPLVVIVLVWLTTVYYTNQMYRRAIKEQADGFLEHSIYNLGYTNPNKNSKYKKATGKNLIPFGFETEFID